MLWACFYVSAFVFSSVSLTRKLPQRYSSPKIYVCSLARIHRRRSANRAQDLPTPATHDVEMKGAAGVLQARFPAAMLHAQYSARTLRVVRVLPWRFWHIPPRLLNPARSVPPVICHRLCECVLSLRVSVLCVSRLLLPVGDIGIWHKHC